MSKAQDVNTLCALVGATAARVVDARDGWPGHIELHLSTGWTPFSVHVGRIHSMARKKYEYRFQNPGNNHPVRTLKGTSPLLLGIWNTDQPNVLVAAQPELRLGDMTRFSVLFPDRLFREAQQFGWAEPYRNSAGGLHWSFLPQLLPIFAESYQSQIELPPADIQIAVVGAGLTDDPSDASAGRARHAATRLVRSARFAKIVVEAYGRKCAMCGLNHGLVSAAHIFPVSAAGSTDHPTNGLALCENHHRAFDRHCVWVDPVTRAVKIHPRILGHTSDPVTDAFVKAIFKKVVPPTDAGLAPTKKNFEERYTYFGDSYDWVT